MGLGPVIWPSVGCFCIFLVVPFLKGRRRLWLLCFVVFVCAITFALVYRLKTTIHDPAIWTTTCGVLQLFLVSDRRLYQQRSCIFSRFSLGGEGLLYGVTVP
jgi:hypothetical protein